jgi:N-acetylmuramoyl-L-alanine amidase
MRTLLFSFSLFLSLGSFAQNSDKPFIRFASPQRETNTVRNPRQFVSGSTCKGCSLSINGELITVYATGGFAYEMDLVAGDTSFSFLATAPNNQKTTKLLRYIYSLPPAPDTVKTLDIVSIETFPEGNLVLQPGDRIKFRVKGLPGCTVTANGSIPLYEMPTTGVNRMPGIYQGEYVLRQTDTLSASKIAIRIVDEKGKSLTKYTDSRVSVFNAAAPDMAITKGRLAHLLFGLGEDRLGGAKIGYLDSMIPLRIVGKVGSNYKVQLSKYHSAYIPDDVADFLPKGTFTPESLTATWRVYGDSAFDYVNVGLFSRLPYQSMQQIDPSRIVVDIFGATNNTNWITQLENTKEIKNVYYEQVEDDVFRVTIELKHSQQWGYKIYYRGNSLVIQVRRQPESLLLKNLRIAIDAGHGGSNTGADGPTGSSEKMLTLAVALKLKQALRQQGATVLMTRNTEIFVDNKERILMYRDSMPDLLVSVHLNSSNDPVHVGGTSTYYRYIGFRSLSNDLYKRMLELGLKGYGNTGSFNFMLNSPIEYPNALVEMLFLSNPEEEMKILDEGFQQQVADKIVLGIKDFLNAAAEP